jgi:hypothetical protein
LTRRQSREGRGANGGCAAARSRSRQTRSTEQLELRQHAHGHGTKGGNLFRPDSLPADCRLLAQVAEKQKPAAEFGACRPCAQRASTNAVGTGSPARASPPSFHTVRLHSLALLCCGAPPAARDSSTCDDTQKKKNNTGTHARRFVEPAHTRATPRT